jgi:hypothetical protein
MVSPCWWVVSESLHPGMVDDMHTKAIRMCKTGYACEAMQKSCCAHKASRGFEPRSLDSESRVLTVTPRGQVVINTVASTYELVLDLAFTIELRQSLPSATQFRDAML